MTKLSLRQIVIPLVTLAIICFMYFGPITRTAFENIILSVIIIIANYLEYKGKPFSALGFYREKFTAKNLLLLAPLVAFVLFVFYVFVLVPGIEMLTGVPIDYSSMSQVKGNLTTTVVWLSIVWATAAFGEETIFRGYFMRQFIKFFGDGKISLVINVLIFCSFFGYMHMQQGITGQIVAGSTGALLSVIFYLRKYDLWFNVMVHGFFNTLGILSFYFGLA
ncbi:CPBP family intramembrane metalloprotease [Muricauda sp. JGD-17]|uniref:CPBP family intramembrane metalloprotease n=1 Tax=Flagellimonas ochracea TaxID=2696472 RepID=A0A964WYD1_9FLAO|nr:CPBP family intramembrane glutamic endopeptidase [Allomuricauda ochracea]NAY93101.1 CPBP family intramembrane metalloprotease [Allomuricauda ochracea]